MQLILPAEDGALEFLGSDGDRAARNRLQTRWLALRCAQWVSDKVELRRALGNVPQGAAVLSNAQAKPEQVVLGSFAFSTDGLGLTPGNPLSLIQASESSDEATQLAQWFGKLTPEMVTFINAFDFKRFEECQVVELLDWHAEDSIAHCALFGIEPERGDDPAVPTQAQPYEMTYVEELIRAYAEADGVPMDQAKVQAHEVYREHLAAAREAFYAAEGLRRFSRDIYVDDEFAKLLEMVRKGIRLKVNSPLLKAGLQRHDAAIDAAQGLTVTDSVLHTRLRGGDLPGTCHQLVNEKHFTWVR